MFGLSKSDLTAAACMSRNIEFHFQATSYVFCVLFFTAPPVTFADVSEKDLFHNAVEQEQLVLSCKVSRADGVVQWYRDGTEIQSNNDITIEAKGAERTLTIHSAKLSDTGVYTSRAGDNILIFKVNVRGNVRPKLIHNLKKILGLRVEFKNNAYYLFYFLQRASRHDRLSQRGCPPRPSCS